VTAAVDSNPSVYEGFLVDQLNAK